MDEANGKNGFGAFESVEVAQMGGLRLKLAGEGESARHRCSHAHDLLEALNRLFTRLRGRGRYRGRPLECIGAHDNTDSLRCWLDKLGLRMVRLGAL